IAQNGIARAPGDPHTGPAVEGDDVARAAGSPADQIPTAGTGDIDLDSIQGVRQGLRPGGVGADAVAQDDVAGRVPLDVHTHSSIARDQIARTGYRAADDVAAGGADQDARVSGARTVADGRRALGVRANQVCEYAVAA